MDEGPACHPEDVVVRLEARSEHYLGHVRLDRIEVPDAHPSWVPRCTSMAEWDHEQFHRCRLHLGHDGKHRQGDSEWTDGQEYGNLEES